MIFFSFLFIAAYAVERLTASKKLALTIWMGEATSALAWHPCWLAIPFGTICMAFLYFGEKLLGTLEQYEIDVLKVLLCYRPSAKEHDDESNFTPVDLSVVTELPDASERYSTPAL